MGEKTHCIGYRWMSQGNRKGDSDRLSRVLAQSKTFQDTPCMDDVPPMTRKPPQLIGKYGSPKKRLGIRESTDRQLSTFGELFFVGRSVPGTLPPAIHCDEPRLWQSKNTHTHTRHCRKTEPGAAANSPIQTQTGLETKNTIASAKTIQ